MFSRFAEAVIFTRFVGRSQEQDAGLNTGGPTTTEAQEASEDEEVTWLRAQFNSSPPKDTVSVGTFTKLAVAERNKAIADEVRKAKGELSAKKALLKDEDRARKRTIQASPPYLSETRGVFDRWSSCRHP